MFRVSDTSTPEAEYDRYLTALGQLCAVWAALDNELSYVIGITLNISDDQMGCLVTEMGDIAPRCRLMKNLIYTVECPTPYRKTVHKLLNYIGNELAPARNRFIHDRFGEDGNRVVKSDRRMKLTKPRSYADLQLTDGGHSEVSSHEVYTLAAKVMFTSMNVAKARFDLTEMRETGSFPERPQLDLSSLERTIRVQLPPNF